MMFVCVLVTCSTRRLRFFVVEANVIDENVLMCCVLFLCFDVVVFVCIVVDFIVFCVYFMNLLNKFGYVSFSSYYRKSSSSVRARFMN